MSTGTLTATTPATAFSLESYLNEGVTGIAKDIVAATKDNPQETAFALHFAGACRKANRRRERAACAGHHVPPFLICSITDRCNLRCKGCYAWANHICDVDNGASELSADTWDNAFRQAQDMGIAFALLAGGEPCMRTDVLEKAAAHDAMLFPVFTNGTLMDDARLELFDRHRNLVPVLSIEGGRDATDRRRGAGIYDTLLDAMGKLEERGILFGASITVTSANIDQVIDAAFVADLLERGVKAMIYVEYVPFDGAVELALDAEARDKLAIGVESLRQAHAGSIILSFPGDERASGGCLAAGRGFCHINVHGGVEPCPFSPYSDVSLVDTSLSDALDSPLFRALRKRGILEEEHQGGCTLVQHEQEVRACLDEGNRP